MKWHLKDGVGLVVRCEYDAILPPISKPTYISIKALNEWDSKVHTTCALAREGVNGNFLHSHLLSTSFRFIGESYGIISKFQLQNQLSCWKAPDLQ